MKPLFEECLKSIGEKSHGTLPDRSEYIRRACPGAEDSSHLGIFCKEYFAVQHVNPLAYRTSPALVMLGKEAYPESTP